MSAYAAVCRRHAISATVASIDETPISRVYEAAASHYPTLLADHLRRLRKNPFASQLLALGEAAQAMAAIRDIGRPPDAP